MDSEAAPSALRAVPSGMSEVWSRVGVWCSQDNSTRNGKTLDTQVMFGKYLGAHSARLGPPGHQQSAILLLDHRRHSGQDAVPQAGERVVRSGAVEIRLPGAHPAAGKVTRCSAQKKKPQATHTIDQPTAIVPVKKPLAALSNPLHYTVTPHRLTQFRCSKSTCSNLKELFPIHRISHYNFLKSIA